MLFKEGVCYDQCVLLAKLLAFALLHFVLQGKFCLLFQVSLDFLLFYSIPYSEKDTFFWLLVLEGLVGLIELFNFSLFSIAGQGIDLDYCDIEWFALNDLKQRSFCRF